MPDHVIGLWYFAAAISYAVGVLLANRWYGLTGAAIAVAACLVVQFRGRRTGGTAAPSPSAWTLELDHHPDRFAVVHRAVAARDVVQTPDAVEDTTRLDPRRHQGVVFVDWQWNQRAVRLRNANRFTLPAVDPVESVATAVSPRRSLRRYFLDACELVHDPG